MVTRAQRRLTSLIETNSLPLCQTVNAIIVVVEVIVAAVIIIAINVVTANRGFTSETVASATLL